MPANPLATRVRAALREQIHGERILERIEHCVQVLLADSEPVTDPVTHTVTYVQLTRERIAALKVVLDVQLRMLGKVLPDLKAVEMTGPDGERLAAGSEDRLVLATKLLALARLARDAEPESAVIEHVPEWLQ